MPGRRQLRDRPKEASEAKELGHFEMDTVISRRGSHGGLPVMLDRRSRRYVIEHVSHISQKVPSRTATGWPKRLKEFLLTHPLCKSPLPCPFYQGRKMAIPILNQYRIKH